MFAPFYGLCFLLLPLTWLCLRLWQPLRRYLRALQLSKAWPGPSPLPLIGNAHLLANLKPAEVVTRLLQLFDEYGNTALPFWMGTEFSLFLLQPADIEAVLGSTRFTKKSLEYNFLRSWLCDGLLLSDGPKWSKRRKTLTPAFHFGILEQFVEIMSRESRIFLSNLELDLKQCGAAGIDIGKWINLVTLDVICESAMGVSVHAQTNADSQYVRAVKTISTVMHKRMFDILYRFDLLYRFTSLAREEKKALAVLHGFTEKIIVQRREELLRAQKHGLDKEQLIDDSGVKRKMAFLDILLQSEVDGKPLSNLDIREEVDTFMFEGHDTTSSAILFFFYNIATYPECQRKCLEEIVSIFGNDKTKLATHEELNKLHYVELCIKETLRLFPSVPLLGRKVTQECEINGKTIPAGTNIGISPLHLGRKEELFPEPDIFKPERFDVVSSAEKINPYAYIPFSAGPRNCIGQRFAMLEIKSVVTNVLRHYEIEYVGSAANVPILIAELILRPKDPLKFKLTPRVY